jgi:predicted DNA binding CopG/RHH family protein
MEDKEKRSFHTLEDEDRYWQANSPILGEKPGNVQKIPQNRDSFLSIRLSAEEIESLRLKAGLEGLGISTYARRVILNSLNENQRIPPDMLIRVCQKIAEKSLREDSELFGMIRDLYDEYENIQDVFAEHIISACIPSSRVQKYIVKENQP